jgi:predicted  nucleic acid-binding Zn-ribbon protein
MEADRWIERVRAQKTHLPELAELTTLEAELRALLGELRATEAEIAPLASQRDVIAGESLRLSKRARDLDAALSSSTANARELSALQAELTHVRELLEASEDRELELLVELEPREARLEDIKHRAQPGVMRRAELQAMIKDLQLSLDEELAALATTREETADAVPAELCARYSAALARSGGSGAAQVIDGRCDGCRIALAPLDYDRFKALPEDTFMDCPECGRLLLP